MSEQRISKAAVLMLGVAALAPAACRRPSTDDNNGQIGAAVGEVMASLDEATWGSPMAALAPSSPTLPTLPILPVVRVPDDLRGPAWRRALDAVLPSAEAAACADATFTGCNNGTRTRSFSSCSLASVATLDGMVTLAFGSTPLCTLAATGDAVTRTASFTVSGLYGGMLTVTSPGGGQTLTKTANGFEYTVGGMERTLIGPGGRMLFDVITQTTAPIELTGSSRADLVIVSGALKINHRLAGYSVTLTPNHLAWSASCNCAVSGSLTGTIAGGPRDGKSSTVELTGCGEADVTVDGQTDAVTLDRCVPQ